MDARKFIVVKDSGSLALTLIAGVVEYHKELVGKNRTKEDVVGGGRWHWDKEKKTVLFYGKSWDFGSVSQEILQTALQESYFAESFDRDTVFLFSGREYVSDALSDEHNLKTLTYERFD